MTADIVLEVAQIRRWAPKIGPNVQLAAVPNGMHDVFLSGAPARTHAMTTMDHWLADQLTAKP